MKIGIDASRAFQNQRTGIEEYSFQVIKNLVKYLKDCQVVLYIRDEHRGQSAQMLTALGADCPLMDNWKIKVIKLPYLWTQLGLSLEMMRHPVDVLFVPGHTVPFIHPKKTIVTIHGLEYEIFPKAYSFWERVYMRFSICNSCRWAAGIIAVSENTKKDLMRLYRIPEEKIEVVYEGVSKNIQYSKINNQLIFNDKSLKFQLNAKYLLFVGRLEERKNIVGIVKAFEILKEHYKIPHKLVLAGKFGYGKEKIEKEIENVNYAKDIVLPGFICEEDKWSLMKKADVFLFPTLYEGFGLPILEAQRWGIPVVASNNSSIPEVTNYEINTKYENTKKIKSVILVDPLNAEEIADATYRLISDKELRYSMIKKGHRNVKRFSWDKCAGFISELIKT